MRQTITFRQLADTWLTNISERVKGIFCSLKRQILRLLQKTVNLTWWRIWVSYSGGDCGQTGCTIRDRKPIKMNAFGLLFLCLFSASLNYNFTVTWAIQCAKIWDEGEDESEDVMSHVTILKQLIGYDSSLKMAKVGPLSWHHHMVADENFTANHRLNIKKYDAAERSLLDCFHVHFMDN